jgi:hypothetical protein
MSTAESILERASVLPDELQQEALRYVEYLLVRQTGAAEARDWVRFPAEQLAEQYAPTDAIYDKDSSGPGRPGSPARPGSALPRR